MEMDEVVVVVFSVSGGFGLLQAEDAVRIQKKEGIALKCLFVPYSIDWYERLCIYRIGTPKDPNSLADDLG